MLAIGVSLDSFLSFSPTQASCVSEDGRGQVRLSPEQMGNAALIAGVGMEMGVPHRAVEIALATAMQESSLRNLDYGDRDSLGLFQQRPSQGWGSPEQVQDRVYASRTFYTRLLELPRATELPLTEAAQAVQISAFPNAYAKHEPLAEALGAALTGSRTAALECTLPDSAGLNHSQLLRELHVAHPGADATAVGEELLLSPGSSDAGSSDPGPSGANSSTLSARWALAHWAVATAADTGVNEVRVDSQVWTRAQGWQEATHATEQVAVS